MQQRDSDLLVLGAVVVVGAIVIGFGWTSRAAEIASLRADVAALQSSTSSPTERQSSPGPESDDKSWTAEAEDLRKASATAQETANQALAASRAAQAGVDSTNEKIDRLFKLGPERK